MTRWVRRGTNELRADRLKVLPRMIRSGPPWLSLVLGVACVALGGFLLARPLSSLSTLAVLAGLSLVISGGADLFSAPVSESPRLTLAVAFAWIAAGLLAITWLAITIDALALIIGVALAVSSVARIVGALRGTTDERAASIIIGLANLVFGVLALSWPDVTLLVVAVLFGARMFLFGLSTIWVTLAPARRSRDVVAPEPQPIGRLRRCTHVVGSLVALAVAVALAGASAQINAREPTIDDFYAAPSHVPDEPGRLLRWEPFSTGVPADARAWRILYTTTRDDNVPALASAIVLEANTRHTGPRPVIAWAHGTTGFARNCAPSVLADPFGAGALPALDNIILNDWVLVATDYIGLGTKGPHPYLIGQGEGRSVLDAVRAAKQLAFISLSDKTVIWGHSQGGHAALWAGILASSYAPDVGVVGVAALAPASDLVGLVQHLPDVTGGSVFASFSVAAYTQTYPDVGFDSYIDAAARTLVRQMAERCLAEPGVFVSVLSALSLSEDRSIFATDPTTGDLGKRLLENTPTASIEAPLLIAQGLNDALVLPTVQEEFVRRRCEEGQPLDYRTYPDRDHVGIVGPESPLISDLLLWTVFRFEGMPALNNCPALR